MVRLHHRGQPRSRPSIIAARLGAEGIVWQFRGSVDGPLSVGPVEVLVDAEDYESARELLLADDVESSFGQRPHRDRHRTTGRDVVVARRSSSPC